MISKQNLLEEIKRLRDELGRVPTRREMQEIGEYSHTTYRRRFGSWNEAVKLAGFEPQGRHNIGREELLGELMKLSDELGRTPKQEDMNTIGKFNDSTYIYRFGSWVNAIEEAGLERLKKGPPSGRDHPDWKGGSFDYYGPNWENVREKILDRDNYTCRVCNDMAENVHHIKPRKDFRIDGEYKYKKANREQNLISLCLSCHMRFEGNWKESDHNTFKEKAKELLALG